MLLPGQSCQVSFQFSPPIGALGPRSASFEFVTGAGSFFIGMSGNAVSGP